MGRFVEGEDRRQSLLLPQSLDDYVTEHNPVRVVEAFIDELYLGALGSDGVKPAATGCGELTALADRGYFNGEHILAYNPKRMIQIFGVTPLLQAVRA